MARGERTWKAPEVRADEERAILGRLKSGDAVLVSELADDCAARCRSRERVRVVLACLRRDGLVEGNGGRHASTATVTITPAGRARLAELEASRRAA